MDRAEQGSPSGDGLPGEVDVAIVGGGAAGLSLVLALADRLDAPGWSGPRPRVVLVDPVHRRGADRTWCFWDEGHSELESLLYRRWTQLDVIDAADRSRRYDLTPMRYVMLRSQDYYRAADAALERLAAIRLSSAVDDVLDGPETATLRVGGVTIRAGWVFDSRPAPPRRPGSTALLQHFRGWTVRFGSPVVDPSVATLMDFSIPQPDSGVAFVYCLPLDADRALVEYTEFSPGRLPAARYDQLLTGYLRRRWPDLAGSVIVEAVEDGTIPMTDAPYPRRTGHRVIRLGTAAGATRPSTGYTFSAVRRQAAAAADALAGGRVPLPPPAYPARHRWMDAVALRALDRGYLSGSDLFVDLFGQNPPTRVLAFLDGRSTPAQELAVMRTSPLLPMGRAAVEDAAARVRRRLGSVVR